MHELIAEVYKYQGDRAHMGALAELAGMDSLEEVAAAYGAACRRVVEAISLTSLDSETRAALVAEANAFQFAARTDPTMFFREEGSEIPDDF